MFSIFDIIEHEMTLGILYNEDLKEYDFGVGHPFRGDRYEIFPSFLAEKLPQDDNYRFIRAEAASDEDLQLVCDSDYIEYTSDYFRQANLGSVSSDLQRMFHVFHSGDNRPRERPGKIEEAARLIVGQAKMGIDLVQRERYEKIVSIGGGMHHAKQNYGEGFCIYNDVAYSAKYLLKHHGLKRVLILDTDAHAGNGTSDYFYTDPRVLFIDLHQDPRTLYPGTGFIHQIGEGEGMGFTVNVPLPLYAGYDSYHLVFDELVLPLTREFKPQIIIRNGGSDPHIADELTVLGLPLKGFEMIGSKVSEMSEICQGKTIDLIASGYNKRVLPYGWMAIISALAGFDISIEAPADVSTRTTAGSIRPIEETEKVVKESKLKLKDYWQCLN